MAYEHPFLTMYLSFLIYESLQAIRRSGVPCPPNPRNHQRNDGRSEHARRAFHTAPSLNERTGIKFLLRCTPESKADENHLVQLPCISGITTVAHRLQDIRIRPSRVDISPASAHNSSTVTSSCLLVCSLRWRFSSSMTRYRV